MLKLYFELIRYFGKYWFVMPIKTKIHFIKIYRDTNKRMSFTQCMSYYNQWQKDCLNADIKAKHNFIHCKDLAKDPNINEDARSFLLKQNGWINKEYFNFE